MTERPGQTVLQERLARAAKAQATYRPSDKIVQHLQTITFGAIIGITGIGKSHLIPFVTKQGGPAFSEVGNISSRPKRSSDPPSFRGSQPIEVLLDRIERRELVNYVIHPSGHIYGTDIYSYTTEFVLLPTLTSALEQLQAMNCFKRIVPIGLVTDATDWQKHLNDRQNDPKIPARMREALECIAWLQAHSHHIPIIENQTDQEAVTARLIINILQDPLHPHALDNLDRITFLLPQLATAATGRLQNEHHVAYNQTGREATDDE